MNITKFQLSIVIFLSLVYLFFLITPINLVTSDLGRHLKNGQIFLTTSVIPEGNFYSYSNPDAPFVNHHWFSGVVFYLFFLIGGFVADHLLFLALSLSAFLIVYYLSAKNSNFYIASILAAFFIPILSTRLEVRPEAFSNLLVVVFLCSLWQFRAGKFKRLIFILPVLEILWVNLHIYFIFGLAFVGLFLFEAIAVSFQKRNFKPSSLFSSIISVKPLLLVFLLCILATLINPKFIEGALYPAKIFNNYGYNLLENQNVLTLDTLISYPASLYFKITFAVSFLLFLNWLYQSQKTKRIDLIILLLTLIFCYLGFSAVRNFVLFGLILLFCSSIMASKITFNFSKIENPKTTLVVSIILIFFLMIVGNQGYWRSHPYGLGVNADITSSAQFFLNNKISGPVLNNYDIGGFLIWYLYPAEKLYVDNRPEAYPEQFFKNTYIPLHEDPKVFASEDNIYHFNAIYFNRLDFTPWGQKFLISRVKDPDWAPVFVDSQTIIFLRRNDKNAELIAKFELPKTMFKNN